MTKGVQFSPIGFAADFGNPGNPQAAYASAIAYGAPDPNAPGGVGNLNNFIYVGTVGQNGGAQGGIYVTQVGGESAGQASGWTDISAGLDGSSIVGIYPSPNRGSHEAYAITLEGIYYTSDSLTTPWTNVTGNLAQIQHNSFGSTALAESVFSTFGSLDSTTSAGQLGGFRSIVADYRYSIPGVDANGNATVHPVLYVAGYGGVFRSLDNGQTWTVFPNTAFDSAPVDGGYLPSVEVTDLQLNLGAINPNTGRPTQVTGDPEVLMATTFGRGAFAIRLAPDIFPTTVALDPASASGTAFGNPLITNVTNPTIDGVSEISNFGNKVTINLYDKSPGSTYTQPIGFGFTDAFGKFKIVVTVTKAQDPSFFVDGVKIIGVQATDSSGATGNITNITYVLKSTPPLAPGTPFLETPSDSGRINNDDITNILSPVFDVTTTEPTTTTVQLQRSTSPTAGFIVVASVPAGSSPVKLTDTNLTALVGTGTINQVFYYRSVQIDQAGNVSPPSPTLKVTVDNVRPVAPKTITLDPSTNSGPKTAPFITKFSNPIFDATGVLPGDELYLFRSIGGGPITNVGHGQPGASTVQDVLGVPAGADGSYFYQIVQIDVAGNTSPLGPGILVQISRTLPPAPTINITQADDSGAPTNPQITKVRTPHLFGQLPAGSNTAGLTIDIIVTVKNASGAYVAYNNGQPVATTTVTSSLTYGTQITSPLPDGTYNIYARITDKAGNQNSSTPLNLTIKATAPQVVPNLSILAADDTGVKGDGVTANRTPRFVGVTDPGDTVKLYSVAANGALSLQAQGTSSTVNGSFTLTLPNALTDGNATLVAQTSDSAGNTGTLSSPFSFRIITVAGDYTDSGAAQLTVFHPVNTGGSGTDNSETYIVRGVGSSKVDTTAGRDVPVQYDFDGDGKDDLVGYQFNSATYVGTRTTQGKLSSQYGLPGVGLPVSGNFAANGTFVLGEYRPNTATWIVNVPTAGGLTVQFGLPGVDIPVPAAYNGNGLTEIADFRPVPTSSTALDGDQFSVYVAATSTQAAYGYSIPFSKVAGFTYQAGDIPAPADYDGVGRDEFAIYRPSTEQFFVLNTPNVFNVSTWTLKTFKMNLPGGASATDEPVPEDYDGNGKADFAVYRPSNSTFYINHSSTGIQESIQFGTPGVDVAAAGPLLYRLSALNGTFASKDGYPAGNTSYGPPSTGSVTIKSISAGTGSLTTRSITPAIAASSASFASASLTSSSASTTTTVAQAPTALAPASTVATSSPSMTVTIPVANPTIPAPAPVVTRAMSKIPVLVSSITPRVFVAQDEARATAAASTTKAAAHKGHAKSAKATTVKVDTKAHQALEEMAHQPKPKLTKAEQEEAVAAAVHHLGSIKKGHRHV